MSMQIVTFTPKGNSFSIREILRASWRIFRDNPWRLIGITVFVIGFSGFFQFVQDSAIHKFGSFLQIFIFILIAVAQLVLGMGMTNVAVRASRRKHYSLRDIFRPGEVFWNFLLASLIYGMVLLAGFIIIERIVSLGAWSIFWKTTVLAFLNLVWYFIFGIKFMFASYIIVDKKTKAVEALKTSAKLTNGLHGRLMMLMIALIAINILGAILFFVGLIVTIPLSLLSISIAYLKLSEGKESYDALNRIDPATVVASKH